MKLFTRKNVYRFAVVLALLFGGFILVVYASPYWLPQVLPAVLRAVGVEVDSIYRDDGGTIVIAELSYRSETSALTAKEVVLPNLHQYLSVCFIHNKPDPSSFIKVKTIHVHTRQSALPEATPRETSPVFPADIIRRFRSQYSDFSKWIPPVFIETANLSNEATAFELSNVEFVDSHLSATLRSNLFSAPVALQATLKPDTDWTLSVAMDAIDLTFDASMKEVPSGCFFTGQIGQPGEIIELTSELEIGEPLPKIFRVSSSGFTLSNSLLSLWPRWNGGSIELQSVQIDWDAGAYTGIFQLSSDLPKVHGVKTPLEANFAIEGDLTAMTIQSLDLYSPWAEASLSHPISLRYEDGIKIVRPVENTELDLLIDLSQQSLIDAAGQLEAHAWIPMDRSLKDPVLHFEVSGNKLTYAGQHVRSFQVTGSFERSTIILESAIIKPDLADDGMVSFGGKIDVFAQTFELDYDIQLASDSINTFLKKSVFSDQLWIKGQVEGPWLNPELNFEVLAATLDMPELHTIRLQGVGSITKLDTFKWNGLFESEGAYIISEVAGKINAETIHLELLNLALSDPQLSELVLTEPISIDFDLSGGNLFNQLSISNFELNSAEEKFSGAYSPEAGLSLNVTNFSCDRLNRWFCNPLPSCDVELLNANITSLDPFLAGDLDFQASLPLPNDAEAVALFQGKLEDTGINVETLQLVVDGADVATGSFNLPLRIGLGLLQTDSAFFGEFLTKDTLDGHLYANLAPAAVDLIRDTTGISIASGEIKLDASGNLLNPTGTLEINLIDLDIGDIFSDQNLPIIDSVQLQANARSGYLEIQNIRVFLNQSELEGSLALPMDQLMDWLRSDLQETSELLAALTGELNLKNWEMGKWAELLPAGLFRRSGSLNGYLEIDKGLDVNGALRFQDFALRPTASLPSVDRISGDLILADQRFELQSVSAYIGGSRIAATGWFDIQDLRDILWDIRISGENIPILRTTDMILRSDINLEATHMEKGSTPLIQGRLDLQASVLLIEFNPLASSNEIESSLRPPFFSIEQTPFNRWLLDVTVFGEEFMRVRSPYFKTQLSADFHLGGSFQAPELVGNVQTVDGELLFPGMKMRIDKGEVFIEPSSLNTLQLDFTGTAQSALHVVTMEVSNTMDDPYVQFQSTPELPNTSIARLLATGTTGDGGVSSIGLYLGKGLLGAGSMNETLMDRLTVDFSKERSRSGRQTFSALFELNEDWSLNGEYNQYDAYNMNLIWHLFRR